MSLLTNLVTQIAQQAIQSKMGGQMPQQDSMGGLGSVLGGMMGGGNNMGMGGVNLNNGFGLDDVIGMATQGGLGSGMGMNGGMGGGMLGQVLGSVLGGGMGGGFGNNMGMGQSQSQGGFGGKGMLMAALLPIVLMFIQRNGGLSGTLDKIRGMGLGQHANSWMSSDQNQTLDPNHVSQLFDDQEIEQVANQTGVDSSEVRQGLAELLPQVVDNLTPNGSTDTEQQANSEINEILSQLSQFKG